MDDQLKKLYTSYAGYEPEAIEEMPSSGSNRLYFRLRGNPTLIGVRGESQAENAAFLYMAKHFKGKGLPVPEVYAESDDQMYYIQQDLGDTLLFKAIEKGRLTHQFSEEEKNLLKKTMRLLAKVQFRGAEGMDFSVCYPQAEFNLRSILWDLNYFKYCFLKATGLAFQENLLEDDFQRMAEVLLQSSSDTFMYRDFQSRNVMIKDDQPYFIDFQGGRRGPIYYDLASFLWQAKANYPQHLREQLLDAYLDELRHIDSNILPASRDQFRATLNHFVLFRTLQVLGAYGFRGLYEKKQHFIDSIAPAIQNLQTLFTSNPELQTAYPTLAALAIALHPSTKVEPKIANNLTVTVYSFSFKKGIPADDSGNGGGYVFDCRSTHNPGKYEEYQSLTGLDQPVIDFLEKDGEILTFLQHAWALIDHHTERFIERGFTHLQVSFGCTGGQHRSVYSAQKTAQHLRDKYGVNVVLKHRELSKS